MCNQVQFSNVPKHLYHIHPNIRSLPFCSWQSVIPMCSSKHKLRISHMKNKTFSVCVLRASSWPLLSQFYNLQTTIWSTWGTVHRSKPYYVKGEKLWTNMFTSLTFWFLCEICRHFFSPFFLAVKRGAVFREHLFVKIGTGSMLFGTCHIDKEKMVSRLVLGFFILKQGLHGVV